MFDTTKENNPVVFSITKADIDKGFDTMMRLHDAYDPEKLANLEAAVGTALRESELPMGAMVEVLLTVINKLTYITTESGRVLNVREAVKILLVDFLLIRATWKAADALQAMSETSTPPAP